MARSSPALIRRASAQDAFQAANVWLEARRFAYPAIPACIHTDAAVRLWVQEEVIPSSEVWVAERDARVVAVLALADGWIDQLYVSPAEQGVRIGFRLVQLAKERCPGGLQLWTFESNLKARRFYERQGFAAVQRTDGARNEERSPDIRYEWSPDRPVTASSPHPPPL